jgi:excisionase family DNA binding protein
MDSGENRSGLATVAEAVAFTRLGKSKLYSMCAAGELEHVKIGAAVRIPWRALEELLRRCTVPARAAGAGGAAY